MAFTSSDIKTAPVITLTDLTMVSTEAGTKGDVKINGDYIYVCVATNTWKRAALSAF